MCERLRCHARGWIWGRAEAGDELRIRGTVRLVTGTVTSSRGTLDSVCTEGLVA